MGSPTSRPDVARAGSPRPLGSAALLDVWEEGLEQAIVARALTVLGRALPAVDREAIADLPVGQRDALLLRFRARTFGPVASCVSRCPACEASIEFGVPVEDLLVEDPPDAERVVEWEGVRLRVRPVTSRDQLSLAGLTDPGAMVSVLLQRCAAVMEAQGDSAESVPSAASDVVAAELSRLDPGADLRFSLSCPGCGATWTSVFDVPSYLWREIDAAARRLLADVHALATAYGWSESEILTISPARRRAYLRLVGAA